MILIIDNYDSFTYNLYQYVGEMKDEVMVVRNDEITVEEVAKLNPNKIILSPGPGRPENAGICVDVIKSLGDKIPILGICLGHQAIGYAYGAKIAKADKIMHGKTSLIFHNGRGIFRNIKNPIKGMRYHSLVIDRNTLPEELEITAQTEEGVIMGVRHRKYPVYGLQFHPESILTEQGKEILRNFLEVDTMLQEAIKKIVLKESLDEKEAYAVMNEIMSGNATPSLIGGLLIGLRLKGESVEEITGFAKAMRDNAIKVELASDYVIDTCGTGGDGGKTFNISTAVAIIASAAGVKVAKHGNRAVSSKSGSADVLRELGFNIEAEPMYTKKMIEEKGMGFLFAPKYHVAMKHVAGIRKELATRTVFNVLGPLTNPAFVKGQVVGVYDKELIHPLAEVLLRLGIEKAMVVHGFDGLDEITTTSPTFVSEVKEGKVIDYVIDPGDYGIPYAKLEDLEGKDAKENAQIILNILRGEKGPKRDIVVLNAAAALYIGKVVEDLKEGIKVANYLIDTGLAFDKLTEILEYQRRLS